MVFPVSGGNAAPGNSCGLVAPLIEAESTRAPVGVQAAVVLCCGLVARRGGMNDDQLHLFTTVNVRVQHAAQIRILR